MSATGSMYGLAFGDALGKPTEFLRYKDIVDRYGPTGPDELPEGGLVTDDTQMALAVAEALLEQPADRALAAEPFAAALIEHFLAWAKSPDNNRAPGRTCLHACGNLSLGEEWVRATVAESKGCGANMRVTPVGLVPKLSSSTRAGAAQLQAAITHGHPTGLAAAELTAFATRWLLDGVSPGELVDALRDRCREQRTVYHESWLGTLWRRGRDASPAEFMARGWDECAAAVERLGEAMAAPDRDGDPCLATGEGWIAEEALATALYCFLMFPDEPVRAVARAAASGGDSDSIAALTGAFAGGRHGVAAFPAEWFERIEYRERLARAGAAWDRSAGG